MLSDSENLVIGCDIVDLQQAQSKLAPRFIDRVFGSQEQFEIKECSLNPWLFWAAKEAAFKALSVADPDLIFIPLKFEVNYSSSTVLYDKRQLYFLAEVEHEYLAVKLANDKSVLYSENTVTYIAEVKDYTRQGLWRTNADIKTLSVESKAVRNLLARKIADYFQVKEEDIFFRVKLDSLKPQGVELIVKSKTIGLLSLSHDGNYVMGLWHSKSSNLT